MIVMAMIVAMVTMMVVMAMAMKSENDALTAELRHDLAEVRRLLAASP